MAISMHPNMAAVARLTRQGRFAEALALLKTLPNPSSDNGQTLKATLRSSPLPGIGEMPRMQRHAFSPGTLAPKFARPSSPSLPAGARFEERTYANAEGTLNYKLYVPSSYCGKPSPLVVMLHGCTQSADDFAAGTRMNELSEEKNFLVVYPAQTSAANPSNCWNWFRSEDQLRDRGEPALIAGITRQVMRDFAVDADRVYIAGLSAGGAAAAVLGSTYPDIYAAVGVHSGLACGAARDLPSALAAMKQTGRFANQSPRNTIPTIVFHGDRDPTVNPANGDQVIAQAAATEPARVVVQQGQSVGGGQYTRKIFLDRNGTATAEHWILHGMAHAWSGGSPAGSYTDSIGVDASREMARFFLEHRLKK